MRRWPCWLMVVVAKRGGNDAALQLRWDGDRAQEEEKVFTQGEENEVSLKEMAPISLIFITKHFAKKNMKIVLEKKCEPQLSL